jgi:SAM-dependent methyltransferase
LIDLVITGVQTSHSFSTIVEFGCGTGHNLVHLAQRPRGGVRYLGADWAKSSQELLKAVASKLGIDISGEYFDFFSPELAVMEGYCALTVASMEQIGDRHGAFLDFLIRSKPSVVVHFEPVAELLPEDELLSSISREYFKKRNYLNGYLEALTALEAKGVIEILTAERTGFGSFFIEGYSLIIWRLTKNAGVAQ